MWFLNQWDTNLQLMDLFFQQWAQSELVRLLWFDILCPIQKLMLKFSLEPALWVQQDKLWPVTWAFCVSANWSLGCCTSNPTSCWYVQKCSIRWSKYLGPHQPHRRPSYSSKLPFSSSSSFCCSLYFGSEPVWMDHLCLLPSLCHPAFQIICIFLNVVSIGGF